MGASNLEKEICELRNQREEFSYRICRGGAIVEPAMALKDKKAITSNVHRKMSIAQREEIAQSL